MSNNQCDATKRTTNDKKHVLTQPCGAHSMKSTDRRRKAQLSNPVTVLARIVSRFVLRFRSFSPAGSG